MALILTTTAYAPLALLQGWLQDGRRSQPGDRGGRSRRARASSARSPGPTPGRACSPSPGCCACSAPSPCARCAAPRCERRASRSPSASCARTGSRASASGRRFAYTQPSPGRYPWQWYWDSCFAAIVWRRFDRARARAELESLLAAQRPDGFIGHTIFWDRQVSLTRLPFYNVPRARLPDRDDPAAAAGLGLADRRRRPGRGAADRRPAGLAGGQPRPRGRRPALDRPARRVRPRRLAQVRPGLGLAGERADRLPAAGAAQPPARLRRPAGPRARRPGPLRDRGQHALVALAAGAGPALGDAGPGRAALGRAPRRLRRRGAAGRDAAAASSPGPRWRRSPCPTCRRRSAGAWSRSTCSTRAEFLTPVAPPSVAASEPSYEPDGGRGPIRRYWRGPTWVNSAWLVWLGMRRLGYDAGGRDAGRRPDRRGRARRPARVLRPARPAPAWAPRTSPGRPDREMADPE